MRPQAPDSPPAWLSLAEVLDDVGPGLVRILAEPAPGLDRIARLGIVDAEDDAAPPQGSLVLLAGVRGRAALPTVSRLLPHQPTALAIKGTAATLEEVAETLLGSGCGLVAVDPAMPWEGLGQLHTDRLGRLAGVPAGGPPGSPDLFSIAQTAATLTRAHVVIEDPANRVLAYSPRVQRSGIKRRGRTSPYVHPCPSRTRALSKTASGPGHL